jgi:hypothetical protein
VHSSQGRASKFSVSVLHSDDETLHAAQMQRKSRRHCRSYQRYKRLTDTAAGMQCSVHTADGAYCSKPADSTAPQFQSATGVATYTLAQQLSLHPQSQSMSHLQSLLLLRWLHTPAVCVLQQCCRLTQRHAAASSHSVEQQQAEEPGKQATGVGNTNIMVGGGTNI